MSSYRLKNVIILILLFLNLSLVVLLSSRLYYQHTQSRSLEQQVLSLYAKSGLSLSVSNVSRRTTLSNLSMNRDTEKEASFASFFLGKELQSVNQGGGTILYRSDLGQGRFRSSGYFELNLNDQYCEDVLDFCRDICQSYGFLSPELESENGSQQIYTADCAVAQYTVYRCSISFTFSGQQLQQVSGYLLPDSGTEQNRLDCSAASALMQFLDYRNQNGIICNEVLSLQLGYSLHPSSASPIYLVPMWQIVTDGGTYFVDLADSAVLSE